MGRHACTTSRSMMMSTPSPLWQVRLPHGTPHCKTAPCPYFYPTAHDHTAPHRAVPLRDGATQGRTGQCLCSTMRCGTAPLPNNAQRHHTLARLCITPPCVAFAVLHPGVPDSAMPLPNFTSRNRAVTWHYCTLPLLRGALLCQTRLHRALATPPLTPCPTHSAASPRRASVRR